MRIHRSISTGLVGLATLLMVAGCGGTRPTPAPVERGGQGPRTSAEVRPASAPAAGPVIPHTRVAVLLPQAGPLADAARAIRDGMMAAYYRAPVEQRPVIAFYDSGDGQDIWSRYQQAVGEGAGFVVGPLAKGEVAQLARAGDLPVPVLALNQSATGGAVPRNLYQFALAPEDEAEQVAERARGDGFASAVVLSPQGEWGDRIAEAFRSRWESLGGAILVRRTYDPSQHDFAPLVQGLAEEASGGFVFLVAKPQQGREIRTQLPSLPVYATSHIFTGVVDAQRDRDLEGVRFPDIPWLLTGNGGALSQSQLGTMLPDSRGPLGRLYAMGIDSLQLVAQLGQTQPGGVVVEGQTGTLSLDAQNQVRRRLAWADMRDGRPQAHTLAPAVTPAPVPTPARGGRY